MAGYKPLKIIGPQAGLIQERENFLLPNDGYPVLQNAYVWRERILRKKGYRLLGRLQRNIGTTDGLGNFNVAITPLPIQIGLASFVIGTDLFNDPGTTANPGTQTLLTNSSGTGTLNRITGILTITGSQPNTAIQYFPGLPVMGIRTRELQNSTNDQTVCFDQNYAYVFNSSTNQFQEFIPGTTWNASAEDTTGVSFFWSTNYWNSGTPFSPFGTPNNKLFWVTNNSGSLANPDPIRVTDGTTWLNFTPPTYGQIDATNFLVQCAALLPFRGRLLAFNTFEGPALIGALNYSNRIRWSTIGNPFIPFSAGPPSTGSWRDDIRGQGGYLDIPTSEDIVSVGFVRDNLVIYCERSTWQLRYTGRSIAPFQIEKVNSELGSQSLFSSVQFDTSLVGIGDKGIVECDSYKSEKIDIKIPDLVWKFQNTNNGTYRIQSIRDFENRLAFWTIGIASQYDPKIIPIFPNQRLLYNYENDSWALLNDSLTTLGNYQPINSRTWLNTNQPWIKCKFPWTDQPAEVEKIIGGNQQGFVEYLDQDTVNDVSLFISNVTAGQPIVVTSPNHNMQTGFVIAISGIPIGTPFSTSLNNPQVGLITAITQADPAQVTSVNHQLQTGNSITITGVVGMTELNDETFTITVVDDDNFTLDGIDSTSYSAYISDGTWTSNETNAFSIVVIDSDNFELWKYNPDDGEFSLATSDLTADPYEGGGLINIRENFSIQSKKFNFLDEGQSIQLGFLDILMDSTGIEEPGAISLNVYLDYNDIEASNTLPMNEINDGSPINNPDTFFNSIIPTTSSTLNNVGGTKFWQRVFCPTRANFLTLEYTFSNSQMAGEEQTKNVQIDAQVLWIRKAGRITQI